MSSRVGSNFTQFCLQSLPSLLFSLSLGKSNQSESTECTFIYSFQRVLERKKIVICTEDYMSIKMVAVFLIRKFSRRQFSFLRRKPNLFKMVNRKKLEGIPNRLNSRSLRGKHKELQYCSEIR